MHHEKAKRSMSTNNRRRQFVISLAVATTGLAGTARAQAMVDEKSPQALALGYVADASKADAKKYPKYEAGQHCANCALYQGKPADASGACPLFAGKLVAGKGWCSAWVKKG